MVNKNVIVAEVAEELGISKAQAGRAFDSIFGKIKDHVSEGEKVQIPVFGSFEEHLAPHFKASKVFKKEVNK